MYISVSDFAGILVAQIWYLPRWVCCYELLFVHMRYLPFNRVFKLGILGLSSWRCYHMVYGEFPCCLVRLDMWYSNLEKTFISRLIVHQHRYTCPIALPVRRNPQHRSFFTVVSQPLPHLRFNFFVIGEKFATQMWTVLRDKHFSP
jgi:hypothetical protein